MSSGALTSPADDRPLARVGALVTPPPLAAALYADRL
jgi:hypothetical protein